MKTKLSLSVLGLLMGVTSAQPALAIGPCANGTSLNGLSFNGLSFNGLSFNGLSFNGLSFNGCSANGVHLSGSTQSLERDMIVLESANGTFGGAAIIRVTLPDGSSVAAR